MGAPVEHINTMLAVSDSRWTRRHHQGQSARSTTLEREPSPGGASYDTPSSARPQNKKEWPTGRDVPPHHVEHSSTAANAHERARPKPDRPGTRSAFAGRKDVSRQEIREICRAPVQTLFGRHRRRHSKAAPPNVRTWHKTDMPGRPDDVRFRGKSGSRISGPSGPLMTQPV
jgi:hypothetical protein